MAYEDLLADQDEIFARNYDLQVDEYDLSPRRLAPVKPGPGPRMVDVEQMG